MSGVQVGGQHLDGDLAIQRRLNAAIDHAESAVPDFDDIVESGDAQFRGDVCEHIPLGCLRVGVGHRRSLSSAGGWPHCCKDTISPILPADDAIAPLNELTEHRAVQVDGTRGVTPAMPAP